MSNGDPVVTKKSSGNGSVGLGVDRFGGGVVDPTANVISLVEASIRRLDDLRDAQTNERHEEIEHIKALVKLRSEYDKELRVAESERIDAIRAVDTGAVSRAAEVSAQQAATLATQVAASAETLRGQVEAARIQTATALAQALDPIQKDIQDLRKAQYEQQGQKSGGSDADIAVRADMAARLNNRMALLFGGSVILS